MAVVVAGVAEVVIGTAVVGMALVRAGTAAAATGTGVAGITVVTVAVGELAPRLVWVLALEYSGERSRPLPITVATTIAMITLIPVHPHQRFGIGAMPIRATTPRYPNAPFRGDQ